MVAWRYLRSKKAEGFVSVIAGFSFAGIMLGVATLIIVMSVMNGFRQDLFSRILGMGGHMNVYTQGGPLFDYDALTEEIRRVDGIKNATPVIENQALLTVNGASTGVMVRGINQTDFAARDILMDSIKQGDLEHFRDNEVAIGTAMAKNFRLNIGDQITLMSPKTKSTPFGGMPRQRSYTVGMIFDVGMYQYNSNYIFMPLDTAQRFFEYNDGVSSIEIFLNHPEELEKIRKKLDKELAGRALVSDWRDLNKEFFNALNVERNVMFLILTMIIIVAAFNIISSMIMLVKDKGHDIAIMRTMGATRHNMLKIFILTGASIGFIGTIAGSILGISFALNIESIRKFLEGLTGTNLFSAEIYFLSQLPAEIDWSDVALVIGMAFSLSILATLYPAWRAARLDPVEALRYE